MKKIIIIVTALIVFVFIFKILNDYHLKNTDYLGSKNSDTLVIYFHGLDTENISRQELHNRKIIHRIGKKLKIKFYLPRGTQGDNENIVSWSQDSVEDVKKTLTSITNQIKHTNSKLSGFVGFSNGGYLVNKFVQFNLISNDLWVVSIGSAGSWSNNDNINLKDSAKLTFIIGKNDTYHYKYMIDYNNYLISNNAKTRLVEFEGNHEIPENILKEEIYKYLE